VPVEGGSRGRKEQFVIEVYGKVMGRRTSKKKDVDRDKMKQRGPGEGRLGKKSAGKGLGN